MYRVNEFLTPSERLGAMRIGGLKKLASMGMRPSDFGAMTKVAGVEAKLGLLGAALRTSVLVGAPIGAIWFAISDGIKNDDEKTRKMKATLDHYNDAVSSGAGGLAAAGRY